MSGTSRATTAKPIISQRAACTLTYACNTAATHVAMCSRVGDMLHVEAISTFTNASDATTCTAVLPSGYVIDTAKLAGATAATNVGASLLGTGVWQDAGTAFKVIQFMYASTTSVKANENPGLLAGNQMANGDSIKWVFSVPIVGWD